MTGSSTLQYNQRLLLRPMWITTHATQESRGLTCHGNVKILAAFIFERLRLGRGNSWTLREQLPQHVRGGTAQRARARRDDWRGQSRRAQEQHEVFSQEHRRVVRFRRKLSRRGQHVSPKGSEPLRADDRRLSSRARCQE